MLVTINNHIIGCVESSRISTCPIYSIHRVVGVLHASSLISSRGIVYVVGRCPVITAWIVAITVLTVSPLVILIILILIVVHVQVLVLVKVLVLVIQHLILGLLDVRILTLVLVNRHLILGLWNVRVLSLVLVVISILIIVLSL